MFTIAVNCAVAGGTCFCVSMGTGPRADSGSDLVLTEVVERDTHEFVIESGTEAGAAILADLPGRSVTEEDRQESPRAVLAARIAPLCARRASAQRWRTSPTSGALNPGEIVGIRGPFGTGWPLTEGKDLVIVAGGIGLAPVRPLIYHALANRDQYFCLGLAYGARAPSELLYRDELSEWSDQEINVQVTVDKGDDTWRGSIGVVTPLISRLHCETEETVAVICGPEVMMKVAARALNDRGVPRENIYLTLERNMKCGIGLCGHCQFGPRFICKDGPVVSYAQVAQQLRIGSL
ncbi:MAG: FAD/NAD(P)-binding protein [Acidimicrobiia bacterium]